MYHIDLQKDNNFFSDVRLEKVIRYYEELVLLIALAAIALTVAQLSGAGSLFTQMSTFFSQHGFVVTIIGLGLFAALPFGIYLFSSNHKREGFDQEHFFQRYYFFRILSVVSRFIFSMGLDLLLLPCAGVLILMAKCWKSNFDPIEYQKDQIPILLIHGSDFNETEWVVGRQFLKNYGSVFSLNYDGLVIHDPNKGPDDYAREEVRNKVLEIIRLTGHNQLIIIGHSMGGLIAGDYAENYAHLDHVTIPKIITIATPWQGAPLATYLSHSCLANKRLAQMSPESDYLKDLTTRVLAAETSGDRLYFNIASTTDPAVPGKHGIVTKDPSRIRLFTYLGHYGLVVWPSSWLQVHHWLDQA